MQTLEKALHQPMPFTTGGQTITDRLIAAKHSLAGSQLGKTICKATTEELMAPKKKHLDYLLHCTNEPNVSIPSMANLLIERTQNPNWIVVYKALITIHNLMCYGNERFSQYLASCNTSFNLTSFLDKVAAQGGNLASGYDMSTHVRRYGKYISEKISTYRLCAFDFCKVKRGREDGLLRTLHTDKLLKTFPILQNQIDALLEFQVNPSELTNSVINCSFILLFRDLIRLFACYNDGVINLLEKYFDMNKKQCREALDFYKSFLLRLDKVSEFLKVAESVGIDKGEIPDLTRAPASLLEALEAHLYHLEGGRGPPPSAQQIVSQQLGAQQAQPFHSSNMSAGIDETTRQKYLEEEKERLRQYEEQRKKQFGDGPDPSNPFGAPAPSNVPSGQADLLNLFDPPQAQPAASQQPALVAQDPNNPFASLMSGPPAQVPKAQPASSVNPFGQFPPLSQPSQPLSASGPPPPVPPPPAAAFNPFGNAAPVSQHYGIYNQTPYTGTDGSYTAPSFFDTQMAKNESKNDHQNVDHALSSLVNNFSISHQQPNPAGGVNWTGGPPPQSFGAPGAYPAQQPQYPPNSFNPYANQQWQQPTNPYGQPFQQQPQYPQTNPYSQPQASQPPFGTASQPNAAKDPFSFS
ncbi:unnamed protein product [Bursaphelenchus okinawaensis]|uniref:ENTH domain-containing protein n=1 Tax=Bursaphelenchus okinawaensis TaxID=465554 RepID=A0A811JTW0_9BILA|nr:unnamed protein product [Bursaphelenchus okinawaensis]CAG9082879.1 unnamed protein product [Bursaphelenchus okinawaensis]